MYCALTYQADHWLHEAHQVLVGLDCQEVRSFQGDHFHLLEWEGKAGMNRR